MSGFTWEGDCSRFFGPFSAEMFEDSSSELLLLLLLLLSWLGIGFFFFFNDDRILLTVVLFLDECSPFLSGVGFLPRVIDERTLLMAEVIIFRRLRVGGRGCCPTRDDFSFL
jgi:hypothetical protein